MSKWNDILDFLEPKEPLYCPEEPSMTQKVFLRTNAQEALFGGMAGGGKAIVQHTALPTPLGWTSMGDVQVGEFLLDENGEPCKVLAKSEVMYGHHCSRLHFSDGTSVIADDQHLWPILNGGVNLIWTTKTISKARDAGMECWILTPSGKNVAVRIEAVETVSSLPVQCVAVSSESSLFLAGEGKIPTHNSSALLMSALQFVDVPGYNAMIFRRTFADLALPAAIMDRFIQWMSVYPEVRFNHSTYTATFPSGARVVFGYLNNKDDYLRYKGSELQYIGFDEVTEIREFDYRYMFSRLRRPAYGPLSQVPLRVRAASNPAPNWVRQRFIVEGRETGRIFVPSSFHENPGVDTAAYQKTLAELDPIERRRLEFGDWFATNLGSLFLRENFEIVDPSSIPSLDTPGVKAVRFWDFAASEESATNTDPDWTVGTLAYYHDGRFYVVDVRRIRARSDKVEQLVAQTAHEDGVRVPIRMEQEPGSAGKIVVDQYARYVVPQYDFQGIRSTGDKETRAQPYATATANGRVLVARAAWLTDWLDEHASFPEACEHDDQVDSATGAFNHLSGLGGRWPKKARLIL